MKLSKEGVLAETETVCFNNGDLLYTDKAFNGLFRMSRERKEVSLVACFPEEKFGNERLFGSIVCNQRHIYLIPFHAKKMYSIDDDGKMDVFEMKMIELKEAVSYSKKPNFLSAHVYKDYIVMVGSSYPAIVIFDCQTKTFQYYSDWVCEVDDYTNTDDAAFFRDTLLLGDMLFLPLCRGNAVILFDLKKRQHNFIRIGDKNKTFSGITFDGEDFWLSPRYNGEVIRWNQNKNTIIEYGDDSMYRTGAAYTGIVASGDSVYLLPMFKSPIIKINIKTGEIKKTEREYAAVRYWEEKGVLFFYDHIYCKPFDIEDEETVFSLRLPDVMEYQARVRQTVLYRKMTGRIGSDKVPHIREDTVSNLELYLKYVNGG